MSQAPAASPSLPVERMRTAVSPAAVATTLLQCGMPAGRAAVVALEGPATVPGDHDRQGETQRAEPPVPGARPKPPAGHAGTGVGGGREGNHSRFFSTTVATAPVAMRASQSSGDRRPSVSVRACASALWSGFGNVSGAGAAPSGSSGGGEPVAAQIGLTY